MKILKNKTCINSLFESGKSRSNGTVLVKTLEGDGSVLFAVSAKKFKRAVDRNLIKRLMRECVRDRVINKNVAFIYVGDHVPSFKEINIAIEDLIKKEAI